MVEGVIRIWSRGKEGVIGNEIRGEQFELDKAEVVKVVIFDNNVYKMTKLSAWEIMEKQGMDADRYFPDDLNQIIRKQYLFKVKYSEFNHNNNSHVYRAEKVTEDVETINYFKNGFFDDETGDEEYSSESKEVNEDDEDYFSSTSIEENENTEDDITSCDKPSNDDQADGIDKQIEPTFIDLSDYETEDENKACNTINKVAFLFEQIHARKRLVLILMVSPRKDLVFAIAYGLEVTYVDIGKERN
nr:hypothetical protein [Tanacetum cinerariifolium]